MRGTILNARRKAFTLIELLVVMFISAILLSIIVIPAIQSFNLTRQAQALSDAQDKGRSLIERIARELGNAVSVRRGTDSVALTLNGVASTLPRDAMVVQIMSTQLGQMVEATLPHSKIDIIKPAEGDPTLVNGAYVNPVTGFADPTITASRGQVQLPVGAGSTILRYAVALRDPLVKYNNPYNSILTAAGAGQDNLFALYRFEFQPFLNRAHKATPGDPTTIAWRPNLALFDSDVTDRTIIGLDDPKFMLPTLNAGGNIVVDAKWYRINHWLGKNATGDPTPANLRELPRTTLMTDLSRYDMVMPVTTGPTGSKRVIFDNGIPRMLSLVSFQATRVSNDPAQPMMTARQGAETDNAGALNADVFRTKLGLWETAIVRCFPTGWNPNVPASSSYLVGRLPNAYAASSGPAFSIYVYDPTLALDDVTAGEEIFDVTLYNNTLGNGRYPFTAAALAANGRSSWLSNANLRALFTPFWFNSDQGKITASFGISEVGNAGIAPSPTNPFNLPTVGADVASGARPNAPYSPLNEPVLGGNFYDPTYATVNHRFNKVWNDNPNLQGDLLERFIDLRIAPTGDGTLSPLYPLAVGGAVSGLGKGAIVPGSEEVYGPNQLPGASFGTRVRYTRTTRRPVGPNQYLINYVDQPEPTDYTLLGLAPGNLAGFNPGLYNPQNFVSAVIQPRFKKGYLAFNSDPNVPLPTGDIVVSYRFQFTNSQSGAPSTISGNKADIIAVDYDTRQLMSVLLTMRNYPQSTIPNPQNVTLRATATVRNYIR